MLDLVLGWLTAAIGLLGGQIAGQAVGPAPTQPPTRSVTVAQGKYDYDFFTAKPDDTVDMVYNYEGRSGTQTIIAANGCKAAINGGFYDKNYRPLGLVIDEARQMSKNRPNGLFNGYLFLRPNGSMDISDRPVYANVRDVIQTGPILVENGRAVASGESKDPARRMVAAKLQDGQMMFVAVYDSQSRLDGPPLSALAEVVLAAAEKEGKQVLQAINLDGGSASAFYNQNVNLKEWQPVGSVWCLK